ncbi:permease [Microbacterium sp.]|uniref:permease n=1 Tax=Microbacterium sp. TaxID=51671 RepID=UPI0039E2F6BE
MNAHVLAMLLRPSRGQGALLVLPVVAFAVVTALILTVLGGVQSFWRWDDEYAVIYQALAAVALVLLVMPLTTLGAAAARLAARRRDERLSTLRLLGVTPFGVGVTTVVESSLLATAGALAGVLGYAALVPLIGLIPFRGAALGWQALLLPAVQVLAVVGLVILVAAGSAVVGLRRVAISPLGVRTRQSAVGVHWIRVVIGAVAIVVAFVVAKAVPQVAGAVTVIAVSAMMFAIGLAVLNLVGPWSLRVSARLWLRRAQTPQRLLTARLVLDDPKAAWRQVSSISMASFMAVFAGTGVALMGVISAEEANAAELALVQDMRTGLILTLVASFVTVAASVGVNQASSILDQRELHRSLHRLGVPMATVDQARTRAVMAPLLVTAIGSALCAGILVFPLLGMALIVAPVSLLTISGVVAAGIAVVWLSTRATRPVLSGAFREA